MHRPSLLGWCRLTKQVSAFYSEVLRLLNSPPLNQHFDKSWTAHVQVKETLYDVESQLQQAAQLHKDDDIAPEIARLKVSSTAVAHSKKMPCKLRAICLVGMRRAIGQTDALQPACCLSYRDEVCM